MADIYIVDGPTPGEACPEDHSISCDGAAIVEEETKSDPSGEPKPEAGQDGAFEISVSADKLVAELKVVPAKGGGKAVSVDEIMKKVSELGLKQVDADSISRFLKEGNFVHPLVIAEGKPPVPGQDGRVEYPYLEKGGAKVDQFGRMDHRNVSAFKFSAKGEQLVKNYPPIEGKDGVSVFGDAVPYPPGKNMVPTPGKNITVSADGAEYFAAESGLVAMSGNVISVDKVLKTEGDVDFNVGNIDFDGTVVITGAVREGFKVKASADVMAALVSQGTIEAGGNVVIEKGIIGAAGTSVQAKGDVTAKFIENAVIKAGGNVHVSEAILHSTVSAGKNVVVRGGKHSNIVGGNLQVAGSVEAATIGTEVATKTVIEIGYDPVVRNRLQVLETELAKQTENKEKVKQAIATLTTLKARMRQLPPDKEALLKKLTETAATLDRELRDFQKEHDELQSKLQHARPGTVSAKGSIMPGTTVTILNETTKINKNYPATTIYLDREHKKIAFTSFKELDLA